MEYTKKDIILRTLVLVIIFSIVLRLSSGTRSLNSFQAYFFLAIGVIVFVEAILLKTRLVSYNNLWGWSIKGKILDAGGFLCWSLSSANLEYNLLGNRTIVFLTLFILGGAMMIASYFVSRSKDSKENEIKKGK